MALFAIGDLHLSLEKNKSMNKFGEQWENHHLKIKNNWIKNITEICQKAHYFSGGMNGKVLLISA